MDLNLALAGIRGFDRVGNSGAASGAAGGVAAPAAQTGPSFADALQNAAEKRPWAIFAMRRNSPCRR